MSAAGRLNEQPVVLVSWGMRGVVVLTACLSWPAVTSAPAPDRHTLIETAAMTSFAESFFPKEMARRQIPGATFVFVSGGEIALARGFGHAVLDPPTPVAPERTVVRLASVSKTITATAAMQLVERGAIELHTDVNIYFKSFRLAAAHGPITLHHLLTHTAGFDERLMGIGAHSPGDLERSSRYLARSMPPTFIAPGRVISYSNHGFAFVGQLVEDVSGRPFADYVREEIFEPLGMHRSGMLMGSPPGDLAVAYEYVRSRHRALSPDYLQLASAGFFFTTATDMGRFLIAHLRGGAYRDRRILQPETVALMQRRHFAQTPDVSGWAYGLWEDPRGAQRALLHNGGGKGYRALLYLLPQQDSGFFLAYNLADRHEEGELLEAFITQFRQRFVPAPATQPSDARVGTLESLDIYVGDYLYVRRARTTSEKIIAVVNRMRIERGENGTLTMTRSSDDPISLTPIGPRLFRRADNRGLVAFDAVTGNRAERLVSSADSGFPAVYERTPFIATLRAQLVCVGAMTVVFLCRAGWRLCAIVLRRGRAAARRPASRLEWLTGSASGLNLIFLVGFPLTFLGRMEGGAPEFLYGLPSVSAVLLFIPPVTTLAGIVATIAVARSWRDRRTPFGTRVAHAVVATALLGFGVFAWYWRLMPTFPSL